jgi:hypothetical protein
MMRFRDGKEQQQMLCTSRKKCDGDPSNDKTNVRGREHEPKSPVPEIMDGSLYRP